MLYDRGTITGRRGTVCEPAIVRQAGWAGVGWKVVLRTTRTKLGLTEHGDLIVRSFSITNV